MNEFKEPWSVFGDDDKERIYNCKDNSIGAAFGDGLAARIVACVNACAGVPTDKLDQLRLPVEQDSQDIALDQINTAREIFAKQAVPKVLRSIQVRDLFAMAAMNGDLSSQDARSDGTGAYISPACLAILAERSYRIADLMLKARLTEKEAP